jgi:large subunit ribosomal protein L30
VAARRTTTEKEGPVLTVTWTRSTIGHRAAAHGTIRALGLHRLNQSVQVADNPVTRGMLRRVAFLVEVEEPADGKAGDAK